MVFQTKIMHDANLVIILKRRKNIHISDLENICITSANECKTVRTLL